MKLRFLENHDQTRAAFLIPDENALVNWTAFSFFQKGLTLVYAGQEYGAEHTPSLFDKDDVFSEDENDIRLRAQAYAVEAVPDGDGVTATAVQREGAEQELRSLMQKLAGIKRDPLFTDSVYTVKAQEDRFLIAAHEKDGRRAIGVFTVKGGAGYVEVDFPDGVYDNLIGGEKVEVFRGGV